MYTSNNIMDFSIIFVFNFSFKLTLTSFSLFLISIKTHIKNLKHITLINTGINIFMCFSLRTYFIIFQQDNLFHCIISNTNVILLSVKLTSSHGIIYAVLSRPDFRKLRSIVSQDISSIWWIPRAMDDASVFGSIIWMIYTTFPTISRALTHLGVSILRGGFSSHFPDVTNTVGICPSRVL